MVHKKVLGKEFAAKVERLSLVQLRALLVLIFALMSESGSLSKKQRKSLAITENQLGIRNAVGKEKQEIEHEVRHSKSKKSRGGKRKPPKNWKKNLRKAIRANPKMSASAKRKALAKLR